MLAHAYPGTPVAYWLDADDQLIATALAVLTDLAERTRG